MDWSNLVWPMDPIEFRDACLGMMDAAQERGACEPGFMPDVDFAAAHFHDLWGPSQGPRASAWRFSAACARLEALAELVEAGGLEPLGGGFLRAMEAHVGVLEAAAVCPFDIEGRMDREAFLREATARIRDIDALSSLLGED